MTFWGIVAFVVVAALGVLGYVWEMKDSISLTRRLPTEHPDADAPTVIEPKSK